MIDSTMFIVSNDEHFFPLRTSLQDFINFFHKLLSLIDIVRRMIIVGKTDFEVEILLLHHYIVGYFTFQSMLLE